MNPIQSLEQRILQRFPSARTTLDPVETPGGRWFLDIECEGHVLSIEWRSDRGFGVSSGSEGGYGEGPEEVYVDLESMSRRAFALLLANGVIVPPDTVRSRESPFEANAGIASAGANSTGN